MGMVTVLVCGERLRGDDAAGPLVAAALAPDVRALAEVREVGGLMPDDLLRCDGPVIVVDAVRGLLAGTVVDLPLDAISDLDGPGAGPASSHALTLTSVVAIASHLGAGRPRGRFVGLAGSSFDLGDEITPAVAAAVGPAAAKVGDWVHTLARQEEAPPCA